MEVRAVQGVRQDADEVGGQSGDDERKESGDAAVVDEGVVGEVAGAEDAGGVVPEAVHQPAGQLGGALAVAGAVLAEVVRHAGEREFAGDEEGVEAGVLQGEPVAGGPVVVAGRAVGGGEPHVAAVVQVGGPVGGVAVVEVGAAEGAGGRFDAGEGAVPGGAVVHAGFPRVDDGRQPPAAEVTAGQEVVVPGGEPGQHPGQEAAPGGLGGVRAVHQPGGEGVHRGLHDAGGLGSGGGARGASRPGGLPEVGAREVGAVRDLGVEDDVREASVGPLAGEQGFEFLLGAAHGEVAQADRDERRVPAPLVGVERAGGDGGGAGPVAEEDPRRTAPQCQVVCGRGGRGPAEEGLHAPDLFRKAGTERTASTGSPVSRHSRARWPS